MRFKVGDRVRITNITNKDFLLDHYSEEHIDSYVGAIGKILDIYDDGSAYPNEIWFDNGVLNNGIDCFKEEELELVEEEFELKLGVKNNIVEERYIIELEDGNFAQLEQDSFDIEVIGYSDFTLATIFFTENDAEKAFKDMVSCKTWNYFGDGSIKPKKIRKVTMSLEG